MKAILFSIGLLIFISCEDSSKAKNKKGKDNISDFLIVSIKTRLTEDDILEVYYAESVQALYNDNNKLSQYVKGDSVVQNVVFRLPDRIYPMKLRIDLGAKRRETFIKVEEIVLSTGRNSKTFEFEEIQTFFRKNQYLEINPKSKGYFRKSIDGVYDPFILSGDLTKITVALFSEN
jgi:hypothetical protein